MIDDHWFLMIIDDHSWLLYTYIHTHIHAHTNTHAHTHTYLFSHLLASSRFLSPPLTSFHLYSHLFSPLLASPRLFLPFLSSSHVFSLFQSFLTSSNFFFFVISNICLLPITKICTYIHTFSVLKLFILFIFYILVRFIRKLSVSLDLYCGFTFYIFGFSF